MKKLIPILLVCASVFLTACNDTQTIDVSYSVNREEDRNDAEDTVDFTVEPELPEYVTIDLSWDESNVTFFSDSLLMDLSVADVVQPVVFIEGENVERVFSKTGNIHNETLTIKDPDTFVNITIQPCQPLNECPLDTVTATITYTNGKVKKLTGDDMLVRGQTGVWYLDVYTQN